jgi:SAM-dependent MidA family methyltransferase
VADWVPIREAWTRALYGPAGFYRREQPSDHFRTSAHATPIFAEVLANLSRAWAVDTVIDVGAGGGELLRALHAAEPRLGLHGVDLRPRPDHLPAAVEWTQVGPAERPTGMSDQGRQLVIANEVLDNIPCDIVELDATGVLRTLEVDLDDGTQRLGPPASADVEAWVARWWPSASGGDRVEVGLAREEWWEQHAQAAPDAVLVAIDYGHIATARPAGLTLTSYRRGRAYAPMLDGEHDVTADVAVDSVAARVGADLVRQR